MSERVFAMTFTVSSDAVVALKPVSLPEEASLIKYDKAVITWPAQGDESNGNENAINTEDIILLAEVAGGGYLILALNEIQPGEEPFRLSSFVAPRLPRGLLDQYLLKELPHLLRGEANASLDIIISVRSGTGLAQNFYDAALQPLLGILGLRSEGAAGAGTARPYRVTLTKDANSVKEFARERWGPGSDRRGGKKEETVILLSGDGGVVDLLNGMATPTGDAPLPSVALVPLGTGNALFHSLHRPHYLPGPVGSPAPAAAPAALALALRALLGGRAAPLPTFRATFSPGSRLAATGPVGGDDAVAVAVAELTGAIVASYGFHSQLVWESDTPAYRVHGDKRFGMVAQELLREGHVYRAVVETLPSGGGGGGRVRVGSGGAGGGSGGGFNYILATMVSNLEKTFTISPHARPLDGVLRLVHFGGVDGQRTMEIMMAAYDGGKHVDMGDVGYEAVEEVKITTMEEDPRWRKVCIDGTIVEIPKDGSMTVSKSPEPRIQVLVLDA